LLLTNSYKFNCSTHHSNFYTVLSANQQETKELNGDKKGKVLPYSLPSAGPGDDPGEQAVSLQVTLSHPPSGRLQLLSARPVVTIALCNTQYYTLCQKIPSTLK